MATAARSWSSGFVPSEQLALSPTMASPSPISERNSELLQRMFVRGLGELFILYVHDSTVILGQLGMKKNRLMLSDSKCLSGVRPADVAACTESGLLGMISASNQYEWASLTFHGLNQCRVKVDLSQTRGGRLSTSRDLEGEDMTEFVGSVYRGFRWLLDRHFLPVVTMQPIQTKGGEWGFAVVDLRMGALDLAAIRIINDAVRNSTERHVEVDIIEEEVQSVKFDELFKGFLMASAPIRKVTSVPPAAPKAAIATAPAASPVPVVAPVAKPASRPVSAASPVAVAARPVAAAMPAVPVRQAVSAVDLVRQNLELLREVVEEIGAPRAFTLFERWATRVAVGRAEYLKLTQKIDFNEVREYFDFIAAQMLLAGETHVLIKENGDTIEHEIRDCIYREACRHSGVDPEGRWSTCAQAIAGLRSKVATTLDPKLAWSWTNCDRRAGHACIFELKLRSGS
jgi:hypothetical protein